MKKLILLIFSLIFSIGFINAQNKITRGSSSKPKAKTTAPAKAKASSSGKTAKASKPGQSTKTKKKSSSRNYEPDYDWEEEDESEVVWGNDIDKFESIREQLVAPEPEQPQKPVREEVYSAVEVQPKFPGGDAALMMWLSKNINYPVRAQENGVEGRVIVNFVVEKDGSISGVKVAKGVDKDLDQEAVRVVKKMPKWQPGKNGGQAVRTQYTLPVRFKLEK